MIGACVWVSVFGTMRHSSCVCHSVISWYCNVWYCFVMSTPLRAHRKTVVIHDRRLSFSALSQLVNSNSGMLMQNYSGVDGYRVPLLPTLLRFYPSPPPTLPPIPPLLLRGKPGLNQSSERTSVPAHGKSRIIADTLVDVVEERSGTGEDIAGRSETLHEHGAVRTVRVLAYRFSGTLAAGAQTFCDN